MHIPVWINKKTISWSLYDFADTAFSALFITFFFPIYIKTYLGGNEFQIGLAMGLSVCLAALLVPLIGTMSDLSGRRLPIIIWSALLTAGITVLVGYSDLSLALSLGFLAHITHLVSKDVYDAKMIDIVAPNIYGKLSGFGTALGYLGSIVGLGVSYLLLSHFGWDSLTGIRAVFWTAALFYIIFSIPLVLFVPDKIRNYQLSLKQRITQAATEVLTTLRKIRQFPKLSRFLLASFLYNNAMNTTIVFLALYGQEIIGLSIRDFFPILGIMSFTAICGSLLAGPAADRWGPVRTIKLVLLLWIMIILSLIFSPYYEMFIITGYLGGAALGSIWTLNRAMIARISPAQKIGQLFGLEGLSEKFSGLFGPIIFGYLATQYSYTMALSSVLVFFGMGLWVMRRV